MKNPLIALLLLTLALPSPASAAMRCGRSLVDVGDHQIDVLKTCGEPVLTERRPRIISEELHHPGRTLDLQRQEIIIVEEWVYNFGPHHFMRSLTFENGILKKIETLGYGY